MGLVDNLEYTFNGEFARRLLIKFFCSKGFHENFDKRVYPPLMQDILEAAPEFIGKMELIPSAVEIDPGSGFARLGWNLFLLGNQRMYLGETEHTELSELAQSLDSNSFVVTESEIDNVFRQGRSARDITNWVTRVLGRSEGGLLRSLERTEPSSLGNAQGTDFFERPKAIRPEGGSQF